MNLNHEQYTIVKNTSKFAILIITQILNNTCGMSFIIPILKFHQ